MKKKLSKTSDRIMQEFEDATSQLALGGEINGSHTEDDADKERFVRAQYQMYKRLLSLERTIINLRKTRYKYRHEYNSAVLIRSASLYSV